MLHAARADESNTDTDVLFHLWEECGDNDIYFVPHIDMTPPI